MFVSKLTAVGILMDPMPGYCSLRKCDKFFLMAMKAVGAAGMRTAVKLPMFRAECTTRSDALALNLRLTTFCLLSTSMVPQTALSSY